MTHSDNRSDQDILSAMMDGEWRADDVRGAFVDVCRDDAQRARWGRYHLARDAMHAEAIDVRGSVAAGISAAIAAEPSYSNVTAIGGGVESPSASADSIDSTDGADDSDEAAMEAVEPSVEVAASARGATLRTFAAGFGLAASVAVVTTVGLNAWQTSDEDLGTTVAVAPTAPSVPLAPTAPSAPIVPSVVTAAVDPFSQQLPGIALPEVELVANTGAFWSAAGSSGERVAYEDRLNMFLSRHIESSPTAERQGMLPYSRLVGYDERVARER